MINFDDFLKVDIRVGMIRRAEPFPKARKPAYKLWIDLGETLGVKKSSAQITEQYRPEDLENQLVLCVVNFPPRQIADFMSEVLTLGVDGHDNSGVILLQPERDAPLGSRVY
ncbi:tRNA-binding protein [Paucidesulfovibrio gracilis DSM 16080]|uniref:tRNA-binding protein n=2 Tax=Paucidesulfovibrio TaxID=2910985 RepID=A0A1T4Y7P8_9BACT|nr:tRNA-binding protein [Paucidesulfovibrio gracilis]SKA97311.1 tRNA-binding protein [Paucidesulfovibrio gracilis DSM 16080]